MVKAVKKSNMLGLNISPKLTINIIIPRITFKSPFVTLYSTSDIPLVNRKIESSKTDNPRISLADIIPNNGNMIIMSPKIIEITLITICLFN